MDSPVNVGPLREITVTTQSVSSRENIFIKPQRIGALRDRLIETLWEWRRRVSSRHELARLTDLELKDIGYPARAEAEKVKPFWRA